MFKALLKAKDGSYKDIFDTELGKTDSDTLRDTMDKISSMEDMISWATVLFGCSEAMGEKLEEVRLVFDGDPQHPGFVRVKVEGDKVIFDGECVP
jgi:hypothetical protein